MAPRRKPTARKNGTAGPRAASAKRTTPKPTTGAKPAKKPSAPASPRFGRSGTAGKAEGTEAVQAWIDGIKPAHQEWARRYDRIAMEMIPNVKPAIKWSTPMYGVAGQGWLTSMASFKEHFSIGFFAGASLKPQPPVGEGATMRRLNLTSDADFDERKIRSWVDQASHLQGWGKAN
jgi:hypothetical protein